MSVLAAVVAGAVQTAPPPTEIFLAPLLIRAGEVVIGKPVNISNNPGYDNQPSFTPDGSAILFTSVRGDRKPDPANSAASGSDIYRYDIASGQVSRVTDTPESEYSPTVTPDGQHISVIRVEADGTQRLWKFTLEGRKPGLVLPDVSPVGYHAWADATTLALFVLGQPATLQVADTSTGKVEIVARDIGRSLQPIPGGGISFVQRAGSENASSFTVMELDGRTRQTTALVNVPEGVVQPDLAWTPDGLLLMAHEGRLYGWRRGSAVMRIVGNLDALGMKAVSRLAISPKGDRIAMVAQP